MILGFAFGTLVGFLAAMAVSVFASDTRRDRKLDVRDANRRRRRPK